MPQPPQAPVPASLHDLVIERASGEGKVKICVLPPEHCKVSVDTPDYSLRDCPYFEYWEDRTLSDLRAMGMDVPDDVGEGGDEDDTSEDDSRNRFAESWRDDEGNPADPSMRRVRARMIWIRADLEGDGPAGLAPVPALECRGGVTPPIQLIRHPRRLHILQIQLIIDAPVVFVDFGNARHVETTGGHSLAIASPPD